MPNEPFFVQIDLTPEYKKNLRDLAKKYRNIRSDSQLVIEEIQKGNFLGDRISRLGTYYLVYKVRINNSNIQKGKRAGYRLIYQVESETSVLLLTIYSKSEKEDINTSDILKILTNFYNSEDPNSK